VPFGKGDEASLDTPQHANQVAGFGIQRGIGRFKLGEVEELIGQAAQALNVATHDFEPFPNRTRDFAEGPVEKILN
jgi:hypothetical protein